LKAQLIYSIHKLKKIIINKSY